MPMGAAMARILLALWLTSCTSTAIAPLAREHNARGAALLAAGDLERAEANLRLALEYAPGLAEARMNLGVLAFRRGRLEEAERELRLALSLREDFGEAWGNLGAVLEAMGRSDDAEAAYVAALRVHPGLSFARRDLGRLLLWQGRLGEARAQLLRLLETDDDLVGHALLAWCELRLERPEAARERIARAFAPDAEAPPIAYLVRAILRLAGGELGLARQDLERAERDPRLHREVALRRAAIDVVLREPESALARLGPLLEEDPFDAAAHLLVARASELLGRTDEARAHAQEALSLVPGLAEAERILGGP